MEVILKFIGIILLVANPETNPTKYDVYIPNAVNGAEVCPDAQGNTTHVDRHVAAIKTKQSGVSSTYWGSVGCNDGKNCQLFPLSGGAITITGVTDIAGTSVSTFSTRYLPHLKRQFKVASLVGENDRETVSIGWLTIVNGVLDDDFFSNDQRYAILTASLAKKSPITITQGKGTITIPEAGTVEIEIVNLPKADADDTPGSHHGGDRSHFLLYYKYAMPPFVCGAPSDGNSSALSLQRRIAAQNSSMKMHVNDDDDISSTVSGNADCSATTWP